ncbi:interleukin-22 receptor subunit alpha-1 [Spea bombifrons]|uniref:interleukin-22 receptor subunit alpha-1 n=1 Tax=Spea bombifrons TaxID=233779 RepID=UPI00234A51DB|nr:interleukin-22 receptor subunit alpha-1 [Spea bombifrons]
MKTLFSFLVFCIISDHDCYGCQNFSVYNVAFTATNFEYILRWKQLDMEANVTSSVQYKRYGDKIWSIKEECQNITRFYCNLTDEFMVDENAFMEQYNARVRAFSKNCSSDWVMSKRLHPIDDTYIDQLELKVIEDVYSITIIVQPPLLPTYTSFYKDGLFKYYMSFGSTEGDQIWQKTETNNTFIVPGLKPDTKYNGSVYILINNEKKSDIKTFVVKTLPDPLFVTMILCMLAILLALSAGVLLYLFYQYVKQQGQIPQSLDFGKSMPFLVLHQSADRVNTLDPVQDHLHNLEKCVYRTVHPIKPNTEQTDALPPAAYFSQQGHQDINNSKMDSLNDYAFGVIPSYKNMPNPTWGRECNEFSYHRQMNHHLNFHPNISLINDEEEWDNCKTISQLSCQDENNTLNVNTSLLLTVTLNDHLDFKGDMDQDEQQKTAFLSNCSNGYGCSDNQTDQKTLEDPMGTDQYTSQHPHRSIQADGLDNTWVCQNPYRLQN